MAGTRKQQPTLEMRVKALEDKIDQLGAGQQPVTSTPQCSCWGTPLCMACATGGTEGEGVPPTPSMLCFGWLCLPPHMLCMLCVNCMLCSGCMLCSACGIACSPCQSPPASGGDPSALQRFSRLGTPDED